MTKSNQKTTSEQFTVEPLEDRIAPKATGFGAGGADGGMISDLDRSHWVDMVQGTGRS